jgi:hypothetical protein
VTPIVVSEWDMAWRVLLEWQESHRKEEACPEPL